MTELNVVLEPLPAELPLREKRIVASLRPVMREFALAHYAALRRRGIRLQFNDGARSPAQQSAIAIRTRAALEAADSAGALADAGLSGFTATASTSLHVFALAYDGEPDPKTEITWQTYGEEAERLGLVWGGRWVKTLRDGTKKTDRPHVQVAGKTSTLRQLAAAGLTTVLVVTIAVAARRALGLSTS